MLRKLLDDKLNFNSSRYYLKEFLNEAAASLTEGALVLDAGAGNCLYKNLFSRFVYESADFCQIEKQYGEITYVCDLKNIPVEDNRYDMVILTQVLEHMSEPREILQEIYRVLKPNGEIWLSAPFFYEEHEAPFDFYRYTRFGFKHLLEAVGFKLQKVDWLEGYYGTISYQLHVASKSLPCHPRNFGKGIECIFLSSIFILLKPLFFWLSILFSYLDKNIKLTSVGYCKNYMVVATKLLD